MQHRAYLWLKNSQELYHALRVEAGREIPRTRVRIQRNRDTMGIEIEAKDLHALRAAINSYLRWINLGMDIDEVIKNGGT